MNSYDFQTKVDQSKGLVICKNWDLKPLNLLNSLALGCYQPSPEVLIVLMFMSVVFDIILLLFCEQDDVIYQISNKVKDISLNIMFIHS